MSARIEPAVDSAKSLYAGERDGANNTGVDARSAWLECERGYET